MTNNLEIQCGVCGFLIGSGLPGSEQYCMKCGDYVVTKAKGNDLGAALGALAVVLVGIGIGALIVKGIKDWADSA